MLPDPAAFMRAQKRREIALVVLASIVLLAIAAGSGTPAARAQTRGRAGRGARRGIARAGEAGRDRRGRPAPGNGTAASVTSTRDAQPRLSRRRLSLRRPTGLAFGQGAGNAAAYRRQLRHGQQ